MSGQKAFKGTRLELEVLTKLNKVPNFPSEHVHAKEARKGKIVGITFYISTEDLKQNLLSLI